MFHFYNPNLFVLAMLVLCSLQACCVEKAPVTQTVVQPKIKAPKMELPEGVQIRTPRSKPDREPMDFPDAVPTLQMKVLGNMPGVKFSSWQNTGLKLRKDDTLYITATGHVGYVGKSASAPDGLGRTYSPSLMPELSFVSLVGRAGDELLRNELVQNPSDLFGRGFVGAKFYWVKRRRNWGNLYLGINDSADTDNSSFYDVKIWIVRNDQVIVSKVADPIKK